MRLNEYASTRRTRCSYKIPTSVQKSIPIDEIYADGTWRSGEVYSQMWSVSDINYAMQSDDKKQDILAKMGRIYSNIPTDCCGCGACASAWTRFPLSEMCCTTAPTMALTHTALNAIG